MGLGRAREIWFTDLERGNVGLSYDVSFILVGAGNRKLLRVEVIILVIFGSYSLTCLLVTYLFTG